MGNNTTAFRPEYTKTRPNSASIPRLFHMRVLPGEITDQDPQNDKKKVQLIFDKKKTKVSRMRWKSRVKVSPLYPTMKKKEMLVVSRRKKKFKILASRV